MNNKKFKLYGFRIKRQTNTVWMVLRGFSKLSIQCVSSLSVSSGHKLQKRAVYSASTACSICLVMWSCISSIIFFQQHYINCCSFYPMKENLDTFLHQSHAGSWYQYINKYKIPSEIFLRRNLDSY